MASRYRAKERPGARIKTIEAIESAGLDELKTRFPDDWQVIGAGMVAAAETGKPVALAAFVTQQTKAAQAWRRRLQKSGSNPQVVTTASHHLARARMAKLAAEQTLTAAAAQAATGQIEGRLRFGLVSGLIVQRLFFTHDLARKPVSLTAFRLLWPLVRQRRLLMPLVQPKGIYCFYSAPLVAALKDAIGPRRCLEIAAGDGTLSRFLRTAGVTIQATDDQSWRKTIAYPADVENLDAAAALERHKPEVVLCSFPPPQNRFEQKVFQTSSVELYVVISTAHRFAAGDWAAYEKQPTFSLTVDRALSRLVLPPEIDPVVLVFRRR